MSLSVTEQIKCSNCAKELDFTVMESINVTINPERKASVIDGSAFKVTCPNCGTTYDVNYSFLYHDMEKKFMIYYAADEQAYADVHRILTSGTLSKMAAGFGGENYVYRIVKSRNEFLEKLRIFDNNLDDRIVEITKLFVIQNALDKGIDAKRLYLNTDDKGQFIFDVYDDTECIDTMPFTNEMYSSNEVLFKPDKPIGEDSIDIDVKWAANAVNHRYGDV